MAEANITICAVIPVDDDVAVELRFAGIAPDLRRELRRLGVANIKASYRALGRLIADEGARHIDHVDIDRVHTDHRPCGCPDTRGVDLAGLPALGDSVAQLAFAERALR